MGVRAHHVSWLMALLSVGTFFGCLYYYNWRGGSKKGKIPNDVPFEEIRGQVHRPIIGKTEGSKWLRLDLLKDPHLLVAARTGYGKTVLLLVLIVHFWLHGAEIHIIDPKKISFRLLRGIPRIHMYSEQNWAWGIKQFYKSMMGYYEAEEINDEEAMKAYENSFHALVIDEFGSFIDMMKETEGAKSESIGYLKRIGWMGREARHQLFIGAQQAGKEVLISTDFRNQLSNKIALGPQKKESWAVLMGETRIRYKKKKGRGLLHTGEDFVEVQVTNLSKEQASEVLSLPALVSDVVRPSVPAPVPGDTPGPVVRHVPEGQDARPMPETGVIAGRKNAAKFCEMTDAAFNKARERRPIEGEWKVGNVPHWTEDQLRKWKA